MNTCSLKLLTAVISGLKLRQYVPGSHKNDEVTGSFHSADP